MGRWYWSLQVSLLCGMVSLPFFYHLTASAHEFFRRSVRRAFFASGQDICWKDLKLSPRCPLLLFNGAVTEYQQTGSRDSTHSITISPLHFGGPTLGGYFATAGYGSVSKFISLFSSAHDAAIKGSAGSWGDQARVALELFNVGTGGYVPSLQR